MVDNDSNDKERTLPFKPLEPDVSIIIDVSDDEKAEAKRRRVIDSDGIEEDTDQLFLPIEGEQDSDDGIPIKRVHK